MPSPHSSSSLQPPGSAYSFWVGLALAGATIAISVFGFSLQKDKDTKPPAPPETTPPYPIQLEPTDAVILPHRISESADDHSRMARKRPQPYQMEIGQHEGRQVYRIRVTASGDEFIIDYTTGKLITVRESSVKPSTPPVPLGARTGQ